MNFKIIVAVDKDFGIGLNNSLPWNYKSDMLFFKEMTKGQGNNAVVMGKNTYLSIGRPLPGRKNIILSTSLKDVSKNIDIFQNINDLCEFCKDKNYDSVWIIGGESIYRQFLELKLINVIYLTEIDRKYECDTFFPKLLDDFTLSKNESEKIEDNVKLTFKKFYKKI